MVTKEALVGARAALELTQEKLAERAGVDVSTVWRWENEGIPERGTARAFIEQLVREADAKKSAEAA